MCNPYTALNEGGVAHDDMIESCVQFSLDTPLSALAQFVEEATKRLFAAFDCASLPRREIEELVRRLFTRKLGCPPPLGWVYGPYTMCGDAMLVVVAISVLGHFDGLLTNIGPTARERVDALRRSTHSLRRRAHDGLRYG